MAVPWRGEPYALRMALQHPSGRELEDETARARCAECRRRMNVRPGVSWAVNAFSEGRDSSGRYVYYCRPCTEALYQRIPR